MRLFLTSLFMCAILVIEVDAAPNNFSVGTKQIHQLRQGPTKCRPPIVIVRSPRYNRYRNYQPQPQPTRPLWGAQYYAPRYTPTSRVTYNPNYIRQRYVEPVVIENPFFKD